MVTTMKITKSIQKRKWGENQNNTLGKKSNTTEGSIRGTEEQKKYDI